MNDRLEELLLGLDDWYKEYKLCQGCCSLNNIDAAVCIDCGYLYFTTIK